MPKNLKFELTFKSCVYLFFLILSLYGTIYFFSEVRHLLIVFFVAFIISEALHPNVTRFEKIGVPRFLAVLLIYLFTIGILTFAISGVVPVFVEQSQKLAATAPGFFQNLQISGYSIDTTSVFRAFESLPAFIAKTTVTLFSNLVQAVLILVITFYMTMQRKNLAPHHLGFLNDKIRKMIFLILDRLENRLASWMSGELILMLVVGLLSYFGYLIIGLEYAASLAIIAGILEIVPNIGPTITTLLACLVGLTTGNPINALLAILVGTIVQQFENHLIVPKVMKDTVGINPLLTIMLLLMGGQLGGVLGAILAIPVYLTIEIILKTYLESTKIIPKVADKPSSV